MKKRISTIIIFFLCSVFYGLNAQDSCKVLMSSIQGKYIGGCKNGLADGQGTAIGIDTFNGNFKKGLPDGKGKYCWKSGEIYDGEWEKGMRNGEGTFSFVIEDRDSIIYGLWEKNIYVGKRVMKPEIKHVYNVDSYDFRNDNLFENRVLIDFMQNGMRNSGVENISLLSSSGNQTQRGQMVGFESIVFPVTIVLRYTSYNKLHTNQFQASIEFTIYEKGDWIVILTN